MIIYSTYYVTIYTTNLKIHIFSFIIRHNVLDFMYISCVLKFRHK